MEIKSISFSNFKVSGYSMFGSTPPNQWQRLYPTVEENLCQWALRSLLIMHEAECILIDTGFSWFDRRILSEYKVEKFNPAHILLSEMGITPEKITCVIHTHLHIDHCGGSFTENDNNKLVPAFPNAEYIISQKQLESASNPSEFERESFQEEIINAFQNCKSVQLIENERFVYPWLELQLFNGHTEGLIVPLIYSGKNALVFVGDMIPSIAHLNLCSTMDYDLNKLLCLAEREYFLEEAYENGYILFFQHDLHYQCCTLRRENKKIVSDKIFSVNNLSGFFNPTD
jgi:glyoxylase-like metal-dependent hydrolase (beta-lactamase superfamily II)